LELSIGSLEVVTCEVMGQWCSSFNSLSFGFLLLVTAFTLQNS